MSQVNYTICYSLSITYETKWKKKKHDPMNYHKSEGHKIFSLRDIYSGIVFGF